MKFSSKVILGLATLCILSSIYYLDNYYSDKNEKNKTKKSQAISYDLNEVSELSFTNKNGHFNFKKENLKAKWKMIAPQIMNASQNAVDNTLSLLNSMQVQQEITQAGPANKLEENKLAEFGLNHEQINAQVTLFNTTSETLKIGNFIDIGEKVGGKINPVSVYAFNTNRLNLLVLNSQNVEALQNKTFFDFRSKNITTFNLNDVGSFKIKSKAETILLKKENEKWAITQPAKFELDESYVSKYIQNIQSIQVKSTVEKNELSKRNLAQFDLNEPSATIQFFAKDGSNLQEIKVGITKTNVNVIMPDGAIGQFNLTSWSDLIPLSKMFKNKEFLSGLKFNNIESFKLSANKYYIKNNNNWVLKSSQNEKVSKTDKSSTVALRFISNFQYMTADDIIFDNSNVNLNNYGFNKSSRNIILNFSKESKTKPLVISIGSFVPKQKNFVYLKRSDNAFIYIVQADWLKQLDEIQKEKL